ncbi:MAG: beta-propeller domain-containing protein [Clostridiales bacterium]|nr:beta-propeller domain-containing protein [Clostridiales bacterium]
MSKDDHDIDFLELDVEPDGGLDDDRGLSLDDLLEFESDFEKSLWSDMELDLDSEIEADDTSYSLQHDIELDAELDAEPIPELMAGAAADADAEPDEPELTEEKQAELLAKRKKRQRVLVSVAAAAWACVIFTFLFINGLGPFAPRGTAPAGGSPDQEAPPASGEPAPAGWATAGRDYQNLFRLIREQTAEFRLGMSEGAGALPDGGIAPFGDHSMNGGVAGSGYESMPQFSDEGDMGANVSPEGDMELEVDNEWESGHSETSEQVRGVREADVVKTDGRYIYAINTKNIFIVKADEEDMDVVSRISHPLGSDGTDHYYFDIYVVGDRLMAIRHGFNPIAQGDVALGGLVTSIEYPITGRFMDTSVDIFDISDRAAPVKIHTLSQSGDYNTSRMVDGYLYLVSTYYGDIMQMGSEDFRTYVPLFARDGEQFTPAENDIYLPPGTTWPSYTVVSGIDAMGSGDFASYKAVYGGAGTIYVSSGAVYLAQTVSGDDQEDVDGTYMRHKYWSETVLTKLTISDGLVAPGAQGRVPGYVLNQLSLDERHDVLRVTTINDLNIWYGFIDQEASYSPEDWERLPQGETKTMTGLYTLDINLDMLGGIEDLAPGAHVASRRFMDENAYFVANRDSVPFLTVDLSDPASPRIASELDIGGFPEYLSPYSEGRLFGLGIAANPETGAWLGLELTMFDNSDPANVKERHSLVLDGEFSPPEQNHKAVLVSADKALVAFPTIDSYLIYSYSEASGFGRLARVSFDGGGTTWEEMRGLFIGDVFYVVGPGVVGAYALDNDFAQIGSLRVDEGTNSVNRWSYGGGGLGAVPLPMPILVD